jgi:hypothetical protein
MTKVKIDKKIFEMSEDASLVLEAHLDKLKLYLEKEKITKQEFDETKNNIEEALMLLLNKQNNIEKNDIEKIIANSKIKKIL